MFNRLFDLKRQATQSFFLFGPRQTGKTTLLRDQLKDAVWVDLLKSEDFRRYLEKPELLRQEIPDRQAGWVVIDEIQKVPALLDEVHWLIENKKTRFALCGSSSRKLRRPGVNLLGGRALRFQLFGLVLQELGSEMNLERTINHGYLPTHFQSDDPVPLLDAYVGGYLRDEIAAEGLVRNLPVFSSFLNIAALSDTELINFSTIARDCGVSSHTIQSYFQILEDTYLGSWLPAYRKRPKRRVIAASKFYFSDVGVVNYLAKRKALEPGGELFGKAFENWVHHELRAYNFYQSRRADLSYWRLASGIEVDFVINDAEVAFEAKAKERVGSRDLNGLRELKQDHPRINTRVVVSLESKERVTDDGIRILPAVRFAEMLWAGEFF